MFLELLSLAELKLVLDLFPCRWNIVRTRASNGSGEENELGSYPVLEIIPFLWFYLLHSVGVLA